MPTSYQELLIIDDDCCHNIVCALAIKRILRSSNVSLTGFTNSTEGLEYIIKSFCQQPRKTLLFLDINMPRMNGWDVLQSLEQLPRSIRKYLDVYVITASPNASDKVRACRSPLVKKYLSKPLSDHLHTIFSVASVQSLQLHVA